MSTSGSSLYYYEICSFAAGIAGNIFAFVLFLSPIPTFKRVIKNKSTEQFSGLPYIYSFLNCLICGWYGLPWVTHGAILVATVNSFGALFQLFYCILFIIYSEKGKKVNVSVLLVGVLCAFALIASVSLELLEGKARQNFVGYLSIASLVSMFASPLSIIRLVIRTKSVEFMPFHLSLATFFMSISFFAYGILLHDLFIYIPNGIGTALGTMQLLFYSYFSKKAIEQYKLPLIGNKWGTLPESRRKFPVENNPLACVSYAVCTVGKNSTGRPKSLIPAGNSSSTLEKSVGNR